MRPLWYNNCMDERVIISSKNAELIYSNRICCYDDEQTDIKIGLTNNKADKLGLSFRFKYSNSSERGVNAKPDGESGLVIELMNFNSPFGAGLKKPMRIAKFNDRDILLLFNVYKNGEANPILDVSLYLENINGK